MLQEFSRLVADGVVARLTLLANHVIGAEPVAVQRLLPHAGRVLRLELAGWPSLLPAWPPLVFLITPAGLLEWLGEDPRPADLSLSLDVSNPAGLLLGLLEGQRPRVAIAGDAEFAADVSWLMDNLRWDLQDDLARVVGDGPASLVGRVGSAFARGLREAVSTLAAFASRRGSDGGAGPSAAPHSSSGR